MSKVINELLEMGAEVIFQDAHVSGHACQEEIKLIYTLVKPKYAVPIHGEFKHRKAQANIARELGYDHEHIFMLSSGDVLELSNTYAGVTDKVPVGSVFVDGLGVGDVGSTVLRDRKILSEHGIIIVVLTLEKGSATVLAGPDIISRGFVYVKESEDLMSEATELLEVTVSDILSRNITDWNRIKNAIRDTLSDFVWRKTKRSPMIMPIIMEVDL